MLKASNPAEMRDVLLEMIGGGEPVLIIRGSDCEGRAPALRAATECGIALVFMTDEGEVEMIVEPGSIKLGATHRYTDDPAAVADADLASFDVDYVERDEDAGSLPARRSSSGLEAQPAPMAPQHTDGAVARS